MKKILLTSLLFIGFVSTNYAQSFEKGKLVGSAGLYLERTVTPITIQAEYGLSDKLGAGGVLWFASGYSFVGLRANYHLNDALSLNNDKVDTFAGLTMGKIVNNSSGVSGFLHGGGRYFISDKLGIFAELNIGVLNSGGSSLAAGVSINLK